MLISAAHNKPAFADNHPPTFSIYSVGAACLLRNQPQESFMKKLLMMLMAVFALALLSAAQTGGYDQGSKKSDQGAGEATLTGCLSGPNSEGTYVLKHGKREVEVGGLDDLSKHVGHEVKLHGSWAKSGSEIGEKEGNEAAEKKGGKEEKGE